MGKKLPNKSTIPDKTMKRAPISMAKGVTTRERLLKVAAELFAEQGYDRVGLQQIGDAAGLLKGSLFGHFKAKRELYVEAVRNAFDTVHDQYEPINETHSAQERLHHYLDWFIPALSSQRTLSRLTLRMILDRDIELARLIVTGSFIRNHQSFISILRDMHPKRDEEALAFFVYSIFTLNDEFEDFIKLWSPGVRSRVGGHKSKPFIESLIRTW